MTLLSDEQIAAASHEQLVRAYRQLRAASTGVRAGERKRHKHRPSERATDNDVVDGAAPAGAHVALRFCYDGAKYNGLSAQNAAPAAGAAPVVTVEGRLMEAIERVNLVPPDGEMAISRCGRTDKGVSSAGQVMSLRLRRPRAGGRPFPYANMINANLPEDIRVLGWTHVPDSFSARFSCLYRQYHYYFLRGKLDVDAMRRAAQAFVGEHDFRNFCKADAVHVDNFVRVILRFDVEEAPSMRTAHPELQAYRFVIVGHAFLYHQVRCMTAVLFLVGGGQEPESVTRDMLDIERVPRKPQYRMADERNLVLHECAFEGLRWCPDAARTSDHLRALASQRLMDALVALDLLEASVALPTPIAGIDNTPAAATGTDPARAPAAGSSTKTAAGAAAASSSSSSSSSYVPLLQRPTEASVDERVAQLNSKKRLERDKLGEVRSKRHAALSVAIQQATAAAAAASSAAVAAVATEAARAGDGGDSDEGGEDE